MKNDGRDLDFARMARKVEKEIIAMRRDFHKHAEPSFGEHRTASVVEKRLRKLGIKTKRMAKTGVAGYLKVRGAKRTIGLRADMDALPMEEKVRLPFATTTGAMHACGHDCHTAILLGVAKTLAGIKDRLSGSVRFIFQPAEELPPGGALAMVEEGVMDGVDEVYGLHVGSQVPSGKIVAEGGTQMANVDGFSVTMIGKGAHGASPHLSSDPVLAAAEAIVSLQQIVARNISPVEPAVISVCIINAGTAYNIIPESCTFRGTVRTFTRKLRRRMPSMIRRVAAGVSRACGGDFSMTYENGYDALTNDEKATARVRQAAVELFGKKSLHSHGPRMGAEDFSEYLKRARGCFFSLGTGNPRKKTDAPHHNPYFKVDESVLWRGAAMLTKLACERGAARSR
ncbi:MAG: M20 metallopeptidase family protein [Planctomycetota bacterium]|jgi:amidohydrolase